MPFTIAGQWVTGLTTVAFIIATTEVLTMTGCSGTSIDLSGGGSSDGIEDQFGVIVNTDPTKDLIGGVRMRDGQSVYAFGRFNPDGSVADVTSAVFQNADGQIAKLFLESGRPVRGVGFDGTTIEIAYTEVSTERLKGTATYLPAGESPATVDFDIDLQKTGADVAALVKDLTGLQISTDEPPAEPDPTASTIKAVAGVNARVADGGATARRAVLALVLVPIFVAITGFAIVTAFSQIANAFMAVGSAFMIAFMLPFIIMGNIMRAAVGMPLVEIQYDSQGPYLVIPRPE